MVCYNVDLRKEELQELDKLFSETPYNIETSEHGLLNSKHSIISVDFERERKRIFSYNEREINIFYNLINSLSNNIKEDIIKRFGKVNSLCKIVEEIMPLLQ